MVADVMVIGSVNIDHIVTADTLPAPGETVFGRSHTTGVGGKGANQAIAAARLGVATGLVAQVGADADEALDALRAAGVDTSTVATHAGITTGTAWITVAAGENTIVVVPGANWSWPATDVHLDAARTASVVLAQLEIPIEVISRSVQAAQGIVIVNAAPARNLPPDLLARCDVLIVNEAELATLAHTRPDGRNEWAQTAARRLLALGVGSVVATLGAAGAVLIEEDRAVRQAARTTRVVDSTGAGDAFCGAFAAALSRGGDRVSALRRGVATGSLAVTTPTARFAFDAAAVDTAVDALPAIS